MQHRLSALDHQRVAGIVATLKTHHCLRAIRQQVHDLALAFVAPLGTNDDYGFALLATHDELSSGARAPSLKSSLISAEKPVAGRAQP